MQKSFTTVRTLTNQTTESSTPASTVGVSLGDSRTHIGTVEVVFSSMNFDGSPTSVTVSIWRILGTAVHKVATQTVAAAADLMPMLVQMDLDAKIYATVALSGGTNVDGTISARVLG